MKVSIKDLQVAMNLGNNGIELDIYDNDDKHLGDLRISKAKIEWCKGATRKGHGKEVKWEELIAFLEQRI